MVPFSSAEINLATRNLLRRHAELGHHRTGKATDAHLKTTQVGGRLDLAAEPATHLAAGVAARQRVDVELLVERIHQLHAAALVHPGILHARIETERHSGAEGEGRILAEIVVRRSLRHLDGALLHSVGGGERRHDLVRGKDLDLESPIGHFRDDLGEFRGGTVDGVEVLGKAGGQTPFQLRH